MAKLTQKQARVGLAWEAASSRLAELRSQELKRVDVGWAIEALNDAFEAARAHSPLSATSGLVEQQALFMKGRR